MQHPARERLKADVALVALSALWAVTFVLVKDALGAVDPFSFLTLRFCIGGLALSLVAGRGLLHRESVRGGLVLSVFLFLGYALQTAGLVHTTPSRSAFITGLYVVLVPVASVLLLRRLPRVASLAGVVVATVGIWVLTLGTAGDGEGTLRGDSLTMGCAAAYALHISLTEKYAPRALPTTLVAVQLWVVALLSALCLPFVEVRAHFTPAAVMAALVCGLFASALAISVQTWAQARTTAVRAAVIFTLEPVFAAFFSVAAGREQLGLREWVGGGLVVLAVLLSEVGNLAVDRWRQRHSVPAP
jgi:drug/metabolite transporter (DMT)-like permease